MMVSVIGAGYVGLVAACCLAHSGHEVTCIERDEQKREKIKKGKNQKGTASFLRAWAGRTSGERAGKWAA